jgi:hypothetical protein
MDRIYDGCILQVLNFYDECIECNGARSHRCYMSPIALREQIKLLVPTNAGDNLEEAIAFTRGEMTLW